jgi:tetratricopeptide (TPR) repeat protein
MGGIGKTQVAMEYAHRFRSAYDLVWWIHADPVTFIDTQLSELASRLEIPAQPSVPDTARAMVNALSRGEPFARWLIVFDNAEEPAQVGRFIPQGAGHVLITSRNKAWSESAQSIHVDVFQRNETIQHLQQRVPTIRAEQANQIGEALGDLPIAVAAAGAWLADTGAKVEDYLAHLREHGPGGAVAATWDLSLERLERRSPAAFRLLQLCSVFAPEVALDLVYSNELAQRLAPLNPAVADRMMRGTLVQQINRLALLKLDAEGDRIQVHRLLQHVVRERMNPDQLEQARHEVHLVLAASVPRDGVDDPATWPAYRMLWPHLAVSGAVNCPDEPVRQLVVDRVRYLYLRGDLVQGRDLSAQVDQAWTELLERTEGEDERRTLRRQLLQVRFNRANILRDLAQFNEAYELDQQVLAEQRVLLGDFHANTLMTAGGLAADLAALGRYHEAMEQDRDTAAAWAEHFGEDDPNALRALNNLASTQRLAGDFRSALRNDERVYERRRLVQGENSSYTLFTATNLGRDIRDAGDYERSLALLKRVASMFAEVSGPDHRNTLNAEVNLAISLRSAGRAAEAAGYLDHAYERLNDTFGPSNPSTLVCRHSRAVNLLALNEADRSTSELEAVRQAYSTSLGDRHPLTLVCLNNQAAVARSAQDFALARRLSEEASTHLGDVLGVEHPYTLAATMNLAVCTAETGDLDAAITIAREVCTQLTQVLGPDHPDTLRGRANLALVMQKLRLGGSEADETSVLEELARRIGNTHPAVTALRERRFLHRVVDPHPF